MARSSSGLLIDVGCGAKPYRLFFRHVRYFGVEVFTSSKYGSAKSADIFFDGYALPFADSSVDCILCSQVLEHVFEPIMFLRELHRVLKPAGRLMLTVPFVWDVHEQPYDYARYSPYGLHYLARTCGYYVSYEGKTLADGSIIAQLTLAYLQKTFRRAIKIRLLANLLIAVSAIPTNIIGLVVGYVFPKNPDLYLDNAMIWIKKS